MQTLEKGLASTGSRTLRIAASLGLGLMVTFASMTPSTAFVGPGAPSASVGAKMTKGDVTDVAFRGRGFGGRGGFGRGGFGRGAIAHGGIGRGGYGGRGYGGRGYGSRGYGYRGGYGGYGVGIGAGLAGLAAGAVIGGAIASSQAAPAGDPVAYCQSRYRSYDPSTGTYRGYDGQDHACP